MHCQAAYSVCCLVLMACMPSAAAPAGVHACSVFLAASCVRLDQALLCCVCDKLAVPSARAPFDVHLVTGDEWVPVSWNGMRASGPAASFYFITWVIIGNFILLSLFLAILISSFQVRWQVICTQHHAPR